MNVLYESSGKTCSVASGTKWARYKPDVPDLCLVDQAYNGVECCGNGIISVLLSQLHIWQHAVACVNVRAACSGHFSFWMHIFNFFLTVLLSATKYWRVWLLFSIFSHSRHVYGVREIRSSVCSLNICCEWEERTSVRWLLARWMHCWDWRGRDTAVF